MADIKGIELASDIYGLEDTSARDTATTASQTATQAGQTATQASQTATTASETATQASQTATTASETATQASQIATAAQTTATQASQIATTASETATQASQTATTASQTATQASQTATQASQTATEANKKIGDLADLETTAKTNLVAAINEVKDNFDNSQTVEIVQNPLLLNTEYVESVSELAVIKQGRLVILQGYFSLKTIPTGTFVTIGNVLNKLKPSQTFYVDKMGDIDDELALAELLSDGRLVVYGGEGLSNKSIRLKGVYFTAS